MPRTARLATNSALFFTGDENLVELAGVVEYHFTRDGPAQLALRRDRRRRQRDRGGRGRDARGGRPHAARGRSGQQQARFRDRPYPAAARATGGNGAGRRSSTGCGVVDAHPPREVVPAYRDVSAAVSDAERSKNQAEAAAAERHFAALAEAESIRDAASARATRLVRRAEGEKGAFLAQAAAHAGQPALTEFRLLWDTLAAALAGRPKLVLDRRAGGRRHVWLADPEIVSPTLKRAWAGAPVSAEARAPNPMIEVNNCGGAKNLGNLDQTNSRRTSLPCDRRSRAVRRDR